MPNSETSVGSNGPRLDAPDTFAQIRAFLSRFNAIDFLSQFSMTFLFTREDQFVGESDDSHGDFRAIEFACGLYGTMTLLQGGERIDETVLREYRALFDAYIAQVNANVVLTARNNEHDTISTAATFARIHSLHVRGDAYPHQYWRLAEAVYSPHDEWFTRSLGFTISEAITIAKAIEDSLNERRPAIFAQAREQAPGIVRQHESEWIAAGMTEEEAIASIKVQLSFWQSRSVYRFTIDEVMAITSLPRDVCSAFFRRLSQEPPFRNPLFSTTFTCAERAAWDYNAMKERPFFTDGEGYWAFMPHLLKEVLYSTFFFDLTRDRVYRGTFDNLRGKVLEELCADFLRRVFPSAAVLLSPSYPTGDEFADVLVLHDRRIVIVQCKSKALTLAAHTGEDKAALKRDLELAIGSAAAQGCRGRQFLETQAAPFLIANGQRVQIDMAEVTEISLISVTYMPLHTFATSLRDAEDDLGIAHSDFPVWSLAIGDLDLVTHLCSSPARFLHYLRRRMLVETCSQEVVGDEMDLLGSYLSQGLWLQGDEFEQANMIGLSGLSNLIDEYVFERFQRGMPATPPQLERPDGFDSLIADIESLNDHGRTDCAVCLMDLSSSAMEQLLRLISQTKGRSVASQDTVLSSMGNNEPAWGMSIAASPASLTAVEARERAEKFGRLKKYARRLPKFAAFGWREGSTTKVDFAIWLNYAFVRDPESDRLLELVFDRSR